MLGNKISPNRLLRKLAAKSDLGGETEHGTAVYTQVHGDSSTVSTKQIASAIEFLKRSNIKCSFTSKNLPLGFTLIEILMVILIISITISFALISYGDFGKERKIVNNAQQFSDYIELVKNESILRANTLAIRIHNNYYETLSLDNHNWQPLKQSFFKKQHFTSNMVVFFTKNKHKNLIIINPSGSISSFTLNFGKSKHEIVAQIIGLSNGSIKIKQN